MQLKKMFRLKNVIKQNSPPNRPLDSLDFENWHAKGAKTDSSNKKLLKVHKLPDKQK